MDYDVVGNPPPVWEARNNRTHVHWLQGNAGSSGHAKDIEVLCGSDGYAMCTGYNKLNHGVNATKGTNITILCKYQYAYYLFD